MGIQITTARLNFFKTVYKSTIGARKSMSEGGMFYNIYICMCVLLSMSSQFR